MDHELVNEQVKDMNSSDVHPIFTRDPTEWMKLVNNKVEVRTEDGCAYIGHVYTVDPVSGSIVLINFMDEDSDMPRDINIKLLMGTSLISVSVISEGSDNVKQTFENMFRPVPDETLSKEQLNVRKQRLKSWLEKHRLPVTVGGPNGNCLTIADALTVQPPYNEDSCLSTNEIILSRIQGLIKIMPADHETW